MSRTRASSGSRLRPRTVILIAVVAVVVVAVIILVARFLVTLPAIQDFMTTFPGETELPVGTPVGFPAWLGWQHFLSAFFLLLIVRTGWQVRTVAKPDGFWQRRNPRWLTTRRPPTKISLTLWLHLSLDVLWVLNGIVFIVLVFLSGQWARIVPTSWETFPNALSAALQYASLQWPTEDGWVNYNSLQLLTYFVTVFIAAPLAILSGVRMSPLWPTRPTRLSAIYPIEAARKIHVPVMLYFVAFTVVHVGLVFATGALKNLNHMYGVTDEVNWVGAGIFAGSVLVMVAAWLLARPVFLRPIAQLTGNVTKR